MHATRPPDFGVRSNLPSTSKIRALLYAVFVSELMSNAGQIEGPDLDEDATEVSLSIKWQYTVAKHLRDLHTYIWQPYVNPPPFCYASLFISRNNTSSIPRALILFSTTRSLRKFRQRYDSISERFSRAQSPAIGLLHTVNAICGVALTETDEFLQDVSLQIFEMVRIPGKLCRQILTSRCADF